MTTAVKDKPRKHPWRSIAATAVAAVLLLAVATHQIFVIVLAAALALLAGVLVVRARVARYRSGGRVAARKRRKVQGWAGPGELFRARLAAMKLTRRICPGAGLLELGTSRRQPVAVCRENSVLKVGVPGAGKTASMACDAADAPGLLFCTSTATDILLHSLPYRKGRVWVLNADGYGGIPSTLAWSPVEGCEDSAVAERRAGDLLAASPRDPSGKDAYHEDRAARLLTCVLHAAAVTGGSMRQVKAWVGNPLDPHLLEILRSPAADPGLDEELIDLLCGGRDGDWITGLIASTSAATAWMRNKVIRAAACPPPGHPFSMAEFARSGDSVYLIGKKRAYGSLAPYFAAFGAELFEQRKHHAEESSGRRPVPATFVLDEMALTCPMPLHDMLAESRKYLVTIIAAVQTLAQLRAKFGEHDGDTIRSASPVEVYFGGEKRHEDLKAVSDVVGDHDTWNADPDDLHSEPLLPPGALRMLRKGKAVILMPECRPVRASLPAIWDRRGHRAAGLDHPALRRPAAAGRPELLPPPKRDALTLALLYLVLLRSARLPLRALGPARREAIAPPYTPAEEVPACRT